MWTFLPRCMVSVGTVHQISCLICVIHHLEDTVYTSFTVLINHVWGGLTVAWWACTRLAPDLQWSLHTVIVSHDFSDVVWRNNTGWIEAYRSEKLSPNIELHWYSSGLCKQRRSSLGFTSRRSLWPDQNLTLHDKTLIGFILFFWFDKTSK